MGKNPGDSRKEIFKASGKKRIRTGGSDGEKYVGEGRARRGPVGFGHSRRGARNSTHYALSSVPESERNDDGPNTRSKRRSTHARSW
jgi:hypothetical protein